MLWFDLADSILIKCFRSVDKWLLLLVLALRAQPDIKNDFPSERIRIWRNFWGEKITQKWRTMCRRKILRQKYMWRVVSHSVWHRNVINQKQIVSYRQYDSRNYFLLKNRIQLNIRWWIVPVAFFLFLKRLNYVGEWQDGRKCVRALCHLMTMVRVNSIRHLRQIWDNFLEVWPLFKYGCT